MSERVMVMLQFVVKGLFNLGFHTELRHLRVQPLLHPELYVVGEELILLRKAERRPDSPMLILLSVGLLYVLRLQ